MSLAQFLELKDKNDPLVVAPANWLILLHDWQVGASYVPESLLGPDGLLQELDEGWHTVGEVAKKAAMEIAPDIKTSDIEGLGSTGPRRTKITNESFSLDYSAQEWRKINLEIWHGADLSDVSFENNEFRGRKQSTSILKYYSALVIGFDGFPGQEVYPYFVLPKVAATKRGKSTLNDADAAELPATLQVYEDTAYGSLYDFGIAGAGWADQAVAAGFAEAITSVSVTPVTNTLAVAATQQLAVADNNGVDRTAAATYVSSAPSKATVNAAGLVTGVASGSATITASYGGFSATCAVTVSS